MAIVTVIALFCCFSSSIGQFDQTIVPETSGEAVVEAIVARIQLSAIFSDDRMLLRRIAYVETRDGTDPRTYRTGYNGGIWQVDEDRLLATRSAPELANERQQILLSFNIVWSSVIWADLRRPLYSGLAARLLLSKVSQEIPLASEITQQANYWKQHYNQNGTVQQFVNDVAALVASTGTFTLPIHVAYYLN